MVFAPAYGMTAYDVYVYCLEVLISVAVATSVIVAVDRLFHVVKWVQLKLKSKVTGRSPVSLRYKHRALPDPVAYGSLYPKVAVQVPMFNERAVCQAVIDHTCALKWPKESLMVQVGFSPGRESSCRNPDGIEACRLFARELGSSSLVGQL